MQSAEPIHAVGTVTAVQSGDQHRVVLDGFGGGHDVLARRCGRMVRKQIRCIVGDRVAVEVSPYDPRRGLITWREKPN